MPPVTSNYQLRRQTNTAEGTNSMKGSKVAGKGSSQAPTFKYTLKNGQVQTYTPAPAGAVKGTGGRWPAGPMNSKGGKGSTGNKSVAGRGSAHAMPGKK